MIIRTTTEDDWLLLKATRLAALLDAPQAFGSSYAQAAAYTDEEWRERAAGRSPIEFVLAQEQGGAVAGMTGGTLNEAGEYILIAMWLAPGFRGSGVAAGLVDAIKARALARGHASVYLSVVSGNERAVAFYAGQGFENLDEWESVPSQPEARARRMRWHAPGGSAPPLTRPFRAR